LTLKRVVIVGGGVGGLASALALKGSEHAVYIVERDPPPPDIAPAQAFEQWPREGVPQFRHAHILLSRIQTTLRDRHPELLEQLMAAGLYLSTVEEILPSSQYHGIVPEPGDGDLLHLWGRRATFEYVVRRYVEKLPNVHFVHDTRVVGIVAEQVGRALWLRGVEIQQRDDSRSQLLGDLVVDATGVRSKFPEWLAAHGVKCEDESHASGFVYACRHYRLNDASAAPPREQGGGNYDYLGYATFYAEDGHYALSLACPEEEAELCDLIRRPEGFEALCEQLPVLPRWLRASTATSKVLGSGKFTNRWRRFGVGEGGPPLAFFPVGDSQLQTNPMYGRGCAAAFVQAEALAEALQATQDPAERAARYYARSRELLQHYYELSVNTDRMYRARARLRRGAEITGPEKLLNFAYERVFLPGTYRYPLLAREFLRSVQMREVSGLAVRVSAFALLAYTFFRGLWRKLGPPVSPPGRNEFLRRVLGSGRAVK
jgi:2-polyprenyl-6-methoxyphenol hydroxylase-like FAD-dependent oxidoreductase